jgi:hypothetical protein
MNIVKSIFSIILLSMLFPACESPLTNIPLSKLPQTESKLVVNSVISPQLPYITVLVTESVPLFTKTEASEKRVENAVVRISDGVDEINIPYDAENKLYSIPQSKFPIKDSKTYFLSVSDGLRSVTARCTVPGKRPVIKSYEFDTLLFDNPIMRDTALTLRISWEDVPADTNYYKVNATIDLEYTIGLAVDKQEFQEKRIANQSNFNWNWQQGRNEFLSDKHLNGATMNSPIGKVHLPQPSEKTLAGGKKVTIYPRTIITALLIEVYNVDLNYYKYQRSIEIKNNSDSPFAEPAPIYSNVNGGLGCFSAYNASEINAALPNK